MTTEEKVNSPQKGPMIVPPALIVLGALLLYGITLQHWVTLSSLPTISKITGWDWHPFPLAWRPTEVAPLFLILTLPVRILPVAWEPLALNAFTAICAALTLGVLAASVRLLPHDRTREQRQREGGADALLSLPSAFLPPLLAVLMMGLQLTFWRDAIAATGEMLNILVFAVLIYCLLKFRISQDDNWLFGFSLLYGLGTTNNWALIGFFPCFFVALIWIKGVNFFNWGFLIRMAGLGILGLSLYLLIPLLGSLSAARDSFTSLLHLELGAQSYALRAIPRWIALVAALPTVLPLLFAGINWPSFEGEISAAGNQITKLMFRLLHVVFLLLALSLFFDFSHSPSLPLKEIPNIGFLTFYYVGALCIGYYSGYILLVYGKPSSQAWERRGALAKAFSASIVGLLWILAVAAPGYLFYENISHIRASHSDALANFSRETLQSLPSKPVVILADDAERLDLLEATYAKEGKTDNNILIDTGCLPYREYINYLVSRYPKELGQMTKTANLPHVLPSDVLVRYVYGLAQKYLLYYLNPSFGYYFETFYLKPHGLVYELGVYGKDAIQTPPPTPAAIKENQDFWSQTSKSSLDGLPELAKKDPDVNRVCVQYSVALDFWGVELQRANYLKEAHEKFAKAVEIHPQNFIADINKQYNDHLLKNNHNPINSGDLIYKAVNAYHGVVPILKYNGPVDEPDLDLDFGSIMADGHDLRQAACLFERRLQLLPGDVKAELNLAKVLVDSGRPEEALDLIKRLRNNPMADDWEVSRVEALAYYAKKDFATAEKLMRNALQEKPNDAGRVAVLAEFYRVTAYAAVREKDAAEATRRFNSALAYINQEVQLLQSPVQTGSTEHNDITAILLKKAEVQMMLKSFKDSIQTLNQIMELQPNNATALLNRAIAETQLGQLDTAKDDYKALRKLMPKQRYVADYGLADIAARQKNTGEEIRCLKRYLDTAPDDIPEYRQVEDRLSKLESP